MEVNMENRKQAREKATNCFPSIEHSSTYEHAYHAKTGVPESTPCPQPTGKQEGQAVIKAWEKYNEFAATYCAAGNSACTRPKTCKPTVTNHKSKKGTIRRKFTPTPGTQPVSGNLECFLTIETSATITCTCS